MAVNFMYPVITIYKVSRPSKCLATAYMIQNFSASVVPSLVLQSFQINAALCFPWKMKGTSQSFLVLPFSYFLPKSKYETWKKRTQDRKTKYDTERPEHECLEFLLKTLLHKGKKRKNQIHTYAGFTYMKLLGIFFQGSKKKLSGQWKQRGSDDFMSEKTKDRKSFANRPND